MIKLMFIRFLLSMLILMFALNSVASNYVEALDFIYMQLKENHPGVYNEEDLTFNKLLMSGYQKAHKLVASAKEEQYKRVIINEYINSFQDNHLWIRWANNKKFEKKSNSAPYINSFKIDIFANKVAWVTVPTFDIKNKQLKGYMEILKTLPRIRNKKAIVFDLRGNQGGNSEYGDKVIQALFGNSYANFYKTKAEEKVYIDWRASKDNLEHIKEIRDEQNLGWLNKVYYGMKASILKGENFYREKNEVPSQTLAPKLIVKSEVFVIIDRNNFSAALDFVDNLKAMKKTTLIGEATKSDRLYMDARQVELPSELGILQFPIKVYCNRKRGDDEQYYPDISFPVQNLVNLQNKLFEVIGVIPDYLLGQDQTYMRKDIK